MARTSEYVGAAAVVIAVLGLLLDQQARFITRFFNISIIMVALAPVLRGYVRNHGGGPDQIRTRTFQYFLALALFFALPPFLGQFPLLPGGLGVFPVSFWNYGTLIPLSIAIVYGLYWVWKEVGHYPYMRPLIAILGIAIFSAGALGIPWAEVHGPAGAVGSTVEGAVQGAVSTASTGGAYVVNSLGKSEQVARIECIMEHGGPAGIAFTASTEIDECVRQKLGGNETVTESDQVTEPVEISIERPSVEPFRESVRVSVPIRNALVHDVNGVPIDIPAEDVQVDLQWSLNGQKIPVSETATFDRIANGDSRVVETSFSYPDDRGWWNRSVALEGVPQNGGRQPMLAPGVSGYTIQVDVSYRYEAEAAFTDSSRWKSGDHQLELWKEDVWKSRSLDFRQRWQNRNCGTVRRFGQEFTKQRTAALTTPIVPVMYADCGTPLFTGLDGEDDTVEISVSATESQASTLDIERFQIHRARTDCYGVGEMQDVTTMRRGEEQEWEEIGTWQQREPGLGWRLNPAVIGRTVDIEGERTTVSCRVNMSIEADVASISREVQLPDLTVG